jgi:hypothetical protein
VQEASAELLHSIAGMIEHREKAKKIIEDIRQNVGINRDEPKELANSREFAETMFRSEK